MNCVVRRYSKGIPARDRVVLEQVWRDLYAVAVKESSSQSKLPAFGRTAVSFIRLMRGDRF